MTSKVQSQSTLATSLMECHIP